jgi:hypothetical protein
MAIGRMLMKAEDRGRARVALVGRQVRRSWASSTTSAFVRFLVTHGAIPFRLQADARCRDDRRIAATDLRDSFRIVEEEGGYVRLVPLDEGRTWENDCLSRPDAGRPETSGN